jgi:hypothetical protein
MTDPELAEDSALSFLEAIAEIARRVRETGEQPTTGYFALGPCRCAKCRQKRGEGVAT